MTRSVRQHLDAPLELLTEISHNRTVETKGSSRNHKRMRLEGSTDTKTSKHSVETTSIDTNWESEQDIGMSYQEMLLSIPETIEEHEQTNQGWTMDSFDLPMKTMNMDYVSGSTNVCHEETASFPGMLPHISSTN